MNIEYLDIVTKDNKPTTQTAKRDDVHAQGLWHRTSHVWILREHNNRMQVLLQKRAQNKDSFPGQYDTSSAGHIVAGTTPRISAVRELEEELGLSVKPDDLQYIGQFKHQFRGVFHDKPFIDNEYTYVYIYSGNVDINTLTLQSEEIESVKWFNVRTVKHSIDQLNKHICITNNAFHVLLEHLKTMKGDKL